MTDEEIDALHKQACEPWTDGPVYDQARRKFRQLARQIEQAAIAECVRRLRSVDGWEDAADWLEEDMKK